MRFLRRHLDAAELGLSLLDEPAAATTAHLASCTACRRRQDRLARRLRASRTGAHAAADAAFTPEVLERQRSAILQRIARVGAGRVLAFPRATAPDEGAPALPAWHGRERRWIVAAAAAGLLIGFAAGQWPRPSSVTPAPSVAAVTAPAAEALRRDDTLLSDVEEALTREVRPEFGGLDGLTPIAYESR